jgi:hypothetical protein
VAVIVLAVLLLLAVGALVWPRETGETSSTPTSSARPPTTGPARPGPTPPATRAPSAPTPSTVPPLGPPPGQAEVQVTLDALVPFVEERRGIKFTARPAVELADNAAFDEQIRAAFDRHEKVWTRRAQLLHVLGVADPRTDLVAVFRANEPVGRMAWYDPQRRAIVVRAQRITPYTRAQMVGALTLALDDQSYGIDRQDYDDSPDELTWGFGALMAGDAARIAGDWVVTLPPAELAAHDRAEHDAVVGADPDRLPPAVRELATFPTGAGADFAAALAAAGPGVLDNAFGEPPRFTTSVLHPDRFLGGVPVVPVPAPAVDGRVVASGTFGELMTIATLADTAGDDAGRAASGWAGDAFAVYEGRAGALCVRIAYQASSPAGFEDLRKAYTTWAASHEGAEVTVEGETLLVSRCITGGRGRSPA